MTMRPSVLVLLLVAALGFGVAFEGRRLAAADERVVTATAALGRARAAVSSVERHRGRRKTVEERRHPTNDLHERVLDALESANVAQGRFRDVSPLGDSEVPGSGDGIPRRRQLATIALEEVTAAEAGRFLAAWREANSAWHSDGIHVQHDAGAGGAAKFTVTLSVSAIYIAGTGESSGIDESTEAGEPIAEVGP
jgi:hypothetical protein